MKSIKKILNESNPDYIVVDGVTTGWYVEKHQGQYLIVTAFGRKGERRFKKEAEAIQFAEHAYTLVTHYAEDPTI